MTRVALVLSLAAAVAGLVGCNVDLNPEEGRAFNYDFNAGAQGWTVGFSDYPVDNAEIFELESGIKKLPQNAQKSGFLLSGMNRSDDLFMFLKRQFSGLEPSTKYYARVRVSFVTNAGVGCMGIGGSPGEGVYLKFGYGDKEPKQDGYYLNLDKGNQAQSGTHAKIIGNIATSGADCYGEKFAEKTVQTTTLERVPVYSDAKGQTWLFVGTDSGHEGLTVLYYTSIEIALESF